MFPLHIGDFFHRRKKKTRARDEIPIGPMLDIVGFWMLLVSGGLLANMVLFAVGAAWIAGVAWDRATMVVVTIAGLLSPVCFWFAMVFWWRMTRKS